MEQTLTQHFAFIRHRVYQNFICIIEDPVIFLGLFVMLGLFWVVVQLRDFWKSPQQPSQPYSQIKSFERKSKRQEKPYKQIDQLTAQKKRLLRLLKHQNIKERQNPQNKLKLASKEFFSKKSLVQSFISRPQSKISNWTIKEKQEQQNQSLVKSQLQRDTKKLSSKTKLPQKEKQFKRTPSFSNLNFSSKSSINLEGNIENQKDLVIENIPSTKYNLFANKSTQTKKDKAYEKPIQSKQNQQPSNINKQTTGFTSLFTNGIQSSLFSQQPPKPVQQDKKTSRNMLSSTNVVEPLTISSVSPPPNNSLFDMANKNILNSGQQSLFNQHNIIKPPQIPKQQKPQGAFPRPIQTTAPAIKTSPVHPKPVTRPKQKLNSQDLLQNYINFVQNLKEEVPITTKVESLMGGARSSPNIILVQAKSLLATIDKNDDKQITAFALKLYQTIIFNFINNSNVKSGLERIPLRERTKQCEKNAINAYILTLNMYRLMNPGKKIWAIVFGKILKMMSFLFKRKEDLKSYNQLQLIQCNYIKKFKEVHSKYVSRIDFLMYFLLGMTAFDPILILKQVETKERDVQTARMQVQSWGNQWSYSQFWGLVHAVLNNKHQSYSKPIFFINLLYVLYPRIFEYKINTTSFKRQNDLFLIVIGRAKNYLKGYDKMKQIKILSQTFQNEQYEYDGADLVKSIQVLDSRFAEKQIEIKMNAKDFQAKANIFYYFTKEK